MANLTKNLQINKAESSQSEPATSIDLTKMLFDSQTKGLAELYESLNKSISINKIIESNKSFQKTHKSLRQICR
jgi:hypothetical protein